jgi:hypothetical protein
LDFGYVPVNGTRAIFVGEGSKRPRTGLTPFSPITQLSAIMRLEVSYGEKETGLNHIPEPTVTTVTMVFKAG